MMFAPTPNRRIFAEPNAKANGGKSVTIECGKVALAGLWMPPAAQPVIILMPDVSAGGRLSPRSTRLAAMIRDSGFGTLCIDLLTENEADCSTNFSIDVLADRLIAAIDWINANFARSPAVGVFAAHCGAAAAFAAAARDSRIGALALRAALPDLTTNRLSHVRCPTRLIVGGRDPAFIDFSRQAINELQCVKRLDVIACASHLFPEPGAFEIVAELARDWFVEHLAGPPRDNPSRSSSPTAFVSRSGGFAAIALTLASSLAGTNWTAHVLHPSQANASYGAGTSATQQVGSAGAFTNGAYHAVLWSGTAEAWIDLNPGLASDSSSASAVHAGQQVGSATLVGIRRASLWSGSASSWVDLHPPAALTSHAYAIHGGQQVGYVQLTKPFGEYHASLWNGSMSWIDLNPPGEGGSGAYAVFGGRQGGYAYRDGSFRAALWNGTAESFVDLKPDGVSYSVINGMDDTQQVGVFSPGNDHACLWYGTKQSIVDLNPSGAQGSSAWGTSGGQQVGIAAIGSEAHASLWYGTADSWLDLHFFAPPGFSSTYGEGIWSEGGVTNVVGYGFNSATRRNEALLWVGVTTCPADFTGDDQVDDADFVVFVSAYNLSRCSDPAMPTGCPCDLNDGDGFVDDSDFQIFSVAYNELFCQ